MLPVIFLWFRELPADSSKGIDEKRCRIQGLFLCDHSVDNRAAVPLISIFNFLPANFDSTRNLHGTRELFTFYCFQLQQIATLGGKRTLLDLKRPPPPLAYRTGTLPTELSRHPSEHVTRTFVHC